MPSTKEIVNATVAEQTAKIKPEAQQEDDASLPLYYRGDLIFLIPKLANSLAPNRVHRFIKTSPENMANKRLKDWRPVEDKALIAALVAKLGHPDGVINPSGHFFLGQQELWSMPRAKAETIRKWNSDRAYADARAPKKAVQSQLSDIQGRSGGAVTPFISEDPLDHSRSK